ncbi:hypothetical protein E2C01_055572 [Portunus trituberculatus]|uniref:Uncharacterized protein n=1 Tax=Portunus trituberculatus TaxID=210409 RepID=A0A5B7GMU2_PORTR|nr:hypothetical protein [Portunus trituberculatus]
MAGVKKCKQDRQLRNRLKETTMNRDLHHFNSASVYMGDEVRLFPDTPVLPPPPQACHTLPLHHSAGRVSEKAS